MDTTKERNATRAIERRKKMKKYAIVTMTGEDGGAATYFDTKEQAIAAAKEKLNDWYTPADRKRKQEMVYECEVDEDGDEIEFIDSIICFPYSEV